MNNGTTALVSRNGSHPEPAAGEIDLLWDGLLPAVTQKLGEPLDEGLVSYRKGRKGRTFAYLEGHAAIDQANRIFGFGGWGWEPLGDVTVREGESVDQKTGEAKPWRAYAATVRVTVPGSTPRTDVGFHAVTEETVEGHETAFKGAVTDALKRALRGYGEQFGNGLYGDGAPGDVAPALRRTIVSLGRKQGFDEGQVRDAVRSRTGRDLDEVPVSELTSLIEAMARKLQSSDAEEEPKAA
ncbi:MAG: Rad52/Rad22 family DNA repair protein [Chloroflexota bacterium]|nr:Rad52/Rad22 family DNA repair protein [Chloroflexota bacterium]